MQTIFYKKQDLENIQGSMGKDGKYSIEDLNQLINLIIRATKLDESEISISVGRNAGYISQCRSRGKVSDNFIEVLTMKYKAELEGLKKLDAGPPIQGIDPRDYIQSLKDQIQLLRDQVKSRDKDKDIGTSLDSLRSELLTNLEANRILLKEIYLQLDEQKESSKSASPPQAQQSNGDRSEKDKLKDGHHNSDISKKGR